MDFAEIRGHEHAKRALEVAAAGNHGILLIGPALSGKGTLLEAARALYIGDTLMVRTPEQQMGMLLSTRHGTPVLARAWACPCGGWDRALSNPCGCGADELHRHWRMVLASVRHYVDLIVSVAQPELPELLSVRAGEHTSTIQGRCARARESQLNRAGAYNGEWPPRAPRECLDEAGCAMMRSAYQRLRMSAGDFFAVLRVARTIADLDAEVSIRVHHVAEALQYRSINLARMGQAAGQDRQAEAEAAAAQPE